MTTDPQNFPQGTILSEMLVDIYASKKRDDVWIMHSSAFEGTLDHLEIDPDSASLIFVFDDGQKNLGSPLRKELVEPFKKIETVTLYQIEMETKKPVAVLEVPVKIT